jgi:hypothetical protein
VGYDKAIELAIEETPTSAPGERFVYSDINFFLLGDIRRAARDERHGVHAGGCVARARGAHGELHGLRLAV